MTAGAILLRKVAERTDILQVACKRCRRAGRYRLETLIERHGPLTILSDDLSVDCPKRDAATPYDRCGAHFAGLAKVFGVAPPGMNDLHEFRDMATAPRDGTLIEVRNGPDQIIVLARWTAQTQAFVAHGDALRRTLHRVTAWRPAAEEQQGAPAAVAVVVTPPAEDDSGPKTSSKIVTARKPRPRR